MINEVDNIKIWDFCKKLSNEYELLHHCIKNKNTNLGVANYDPISRSFFKMWEICRDLNIIDINNKNMVYGALAEGPGGFIECFNFYRRRYCITPNDIVNCITLKPYNSDIPGWKKSNRIFKECGNYKISYGKDDTGDLYNVENISYFAGLFSKKKADLVTGDGGFDFSDDYSNQEILAFRLIFCEAVTGLSILKNGGSMVLKLFDLFHHTSLELIYILCCYFSDVYIVKPFTSRSANSEKYIVCKGFKGIPITDLKNLYGIVDELGIISKQNKYARRIIKNKISEDFKKIIQASNVYFISKQIKSLIKGLSYVKEELNNDDINEIKQQQTVYSLAWCQKYNFPINTRCRFLNNANNYNYIPNF
jgi:23S rRNA U2552 (ribose-2'-O)-methylase RlmE/FtsJ